MRYPGTQGGRQQLGKDQPVRRASSPPTRTRGPIRESATTSGRLGARDAASPTAPAPGPLGSGAAGRLVALAGTVLAAAGVVAFLLAGSPADYAAIVGQQRITIVTLDTEITNLSQAVKHYPGVVDLSHTQETQQTLAGPVSDQRPARPPAGHHGHDRPGAGRARGDLRLGEGLVGGAGPDQCHPRPHPGRQRDPAEHGRRARQVPGHQ